MQACLTLAWNKQARRGFLPPGTELMMLGPELVDAWLYLFDRWGAVHLYPSAMAFRSGRSGLRSSGSG